MHEIARSVPSPGLMVGITLSSWLLEAATNKVSLDSQGGGNGFQQNTMKKNLKKPSLRSPTRIRKQNKKEMNRKIRKAQIKRKTIKIRRKRLARQRLAQRTKREQGKLHSLEHVEIPDCPGRGSTLPPGSNYCNTGTGSPLVTSTPGQPVTTEFDGTKQKKIGAGIWEVFFQTQRCTKNAFSDM